MVIGPLPHSLIISFVWKEKVMNLIILSVRSYFIFLSLSLVLRLKTNISLGKHRWLLFDGLARENVISMSAVCVRNRAGYGINDDDFQNYDDINDKLKIVVSVKTNETWKLHIFQYTLFCFMMERLITCIQSNEPRKYQRDSFFFFLRHF